MSNEVNEKLVKIFESFNDDCVFLSDSEAETYGRTIWDYAQKHPDEVLNNYLNECLKCYEELVNDQYEAHLRADMVAMLEELQLEIEETVKEEEPIDKKWANGLHYSKKIIQQKINALKEKENEID